MSLCVLSFSVEILVLVARMLELGRDRSYVAQPCFQRHTRGQWRPDAEAGPELGLLRCQGPTTASAAAYAGWVGTLCPLGEVLVTDVYLSLCHC